MFETLIAIIGGYLALGLVVFFFYLIVEGIPNLINRWLNNK